VSAPASLLSVSINYLGAAQRRVKIICLTLAVGVVATYLLIDVAGLVGAALADDLVIIVYVGATLLLCARLIAIDLTSIAVSVARIVVAAAAMALTLLIVGTDHLTAAQWVVGGIAGGASYLGALFITGEVSVPELRSLCDRFAGAVRPGKP
jgi:peptidoglycan biosynthesis protein MviN/MurJ (putative lipid II flippase)